MVQYNNMLQAYIPVDSVKILRLFISLFLTRFLVSLTFADEYFDLFGIPSPHVLLML